MVWSGIHPINEDRPCDICESMENVERKQVLKVIYGMTGPVNDGYRQSNLCEDCKSKGWSIGDKAAWGFLQYWNFKTTPPQSKRL